MSYPFKNISHNTYYIINVVLIVNRHLPGNTEIISDLFEYQKPFHYMVNNTTALTPDHSGSFNSMLNNSAVNSVPHHKDIDRQSGGGFTAPDTWSGSIKRLGWPHRRWTVKAQAQNSAGTHTSCLQLLKSQWSPTCVWVAQRHRETLYTMSDHETHFSGSKPKGQNQAGSHLYGQIPREQPLFPKRSTL